MEVTIIILVASNELAPIIIHTMCITLTLVTHRHVSAANPPLVLCSSKTGWNVEHAGVFVSVCVGVCQFVS